LRNKPSDVGLTNFDTSIDEETDNQEMGRLTKIKLVMKSPFFLSICLAFFFVQLLKTLYSDWTSIYLNKTIGIDTFKSTYFVSLFEIFGLFGSIFSGTMSDYIIYIKKSTSLKNNQNFTGKPIRYRLCIVLIYLFGIFVFLHLFNFNVSKNSVNIMLIYAIAAVSGFLVYGCISLLGVMAMVCLFFLISKRKIT
jgi:sugar phosphate permease